MKNISKIISLTVPNGKDMQIIKKYGLKTWGVVWLLKIAGILFILWVLVVVLKFHVGIGQ